MRENSESITASSLDQHISNDEWMGDDHEQQENWDLHTTSTDEKTAYNQPGGIALGSLKKGMVRSFSTWWNRLITEPESFPHSDDTPLSKMVLQKESQIYENELVRSVMARFLNMAQDSVELLRAVAKSNKIFHEDFPGNYILEYKGKRVGMFWLKSEPGINGSVDVSYEFHPQIKSFKWM